MNILYIGPYRLNNSIGYESLNILLELQDSFPNITSRPLYNQSPVNNLANLNFLLNRLENNVQKQYDLIVQHTSIESMVHTTKSKKHLFLPIFNNCLNNHNQTQIAHHLQNYGRFLINKDVDHFILDNSNVTNKQHYKIVANHRLCLATTDAFNFGLYNTYQKYYTITSSEYEDHIKNLIIEFIRFANKPDICLVLFMQNVRQSVLDQYNTFIKKVYQTFNINHSISQVIIIPVELDSKSISAIHSSGNVYVDMNEDIHKYYACKYQKPIISNDSSLILDYNPYNLTEMSLVKRQYPINFSKISSATSNSFSSLTDIVSSYV